VLVLDPERPEVLALAELLDEQLREVTPTE